MKEAMTELINMGKIIITKYDSLTKSQQDVIQKFLEILYILDHSYMIDDIDDENELKFYDQCEYYYINDDNSYLNAYELYQKIMDITSFHDKGMKIQNCVLMSICDMRNDEPKSDHTKQQSPFVLRFFSEKILQIHYLDISDLLNSHFSNVMVSHDDNDKYTGYGYVYFNTLEEMEKCANTVKIFNNTVFTFK